MTEQEQLGSDIEALQEILLTTDRLSLIDNDDAEEIIYLCESIIKYIQRNYFKWDL